jgi:hypothetical protein
MELISEDWEIVRRKTNHWWITTFLMLILDGSLASVTWTVRQKSTGIVKRVTASRESEAADK